MAESHSNDKENEFSADQFITSTNAIPSSKIGFAREVHPARKVTDMISVLDIFSDTQFD